MLKDAAITVSIGFCLAALAHWLLGEEYASRQQAKVLAPIAGYLYGASHRDEITVLLIDEGSLEDAGFTWPTPFAYEARLLHAVGRHAPQSVFVDIYFKDNRKASDIAKLVEELCALKNQGIDVYLGATLDKDRRFRLRPELEEKSGECFKKVSLYFSPDEIDKTAWSYPISPHPQALGAGDAVNSAAVEIYNKIKETSLAPKAEKSNLALTWGTEQARLGIPLTETAEGHDSPEIYCRADQGWREMIPGGLRAHGVKDHEKPICVFHETLAAQELATNSQKEEAAVDKRIRGKIVMLGVSLPESRDHVQTPLHGRIPGVYLHAMALDNLLTYGDDYPEVINFHIASDASHLKLIKFLVLSIVLIVVFKPAAIKKRNAVKAWFSPLVKAVQHYATKPQPRWKKVLLEIIFAVTKGVEKLLGLLLATAATGLVALFGTLVFHIGFISAFSVAMFIVGAEWLEIKDKLEKSFTLKGSKKKPTHLTDKG